MFKYILEFFYCKKEIIIISNTKITRKKITLIDNIAYFCVFLWLTYTTYLYFINKKIINIKNNEIITQKETNLVLIDKIKEVNLIINNMGDYIATLNYYDRFEKINTEENSALNNLVNKALLTENEYSETLPIFDNINRNVNNLNEMLIGRIGGLEGILEKETKLNKKKNELYKVSFKEDIYSASESKEIIGNSNLLKKQNVEKNIKYLNFLEGFLTSSPTSKPIKNYFLTSKFGTRNDPFTGRRKEHEGLDMVGATNSKILVSADGIVEKTGFGAGLGNVIVVNHGNKIKTIYGHLKTILVSQGDKVKRGDEIAVQGSTGRSTGAHLHYEIKIDNENVDPMNLVNMGDKFF